MADARYVRAVLVGGRPSGSFAGEIWQTGFNMCDGDSGGILTGAVKAPLPTFTANVVGETTSDATWNVDNAWSGTQKFTHANLLAIANHIVTLWNVLKIRTPADSRLEAVRFSAFGTDGKVINGANVYTLKAPLQGSVTATGQIPAQLAVTASLRTGARGAAGRGRMFLPLNGIAPASGLIPAAVRDEIGGAVKTLLENVRAVGPLVSVVNRVPLTYSDVDDVQVGNFFDVQRRRENAKAETYTSYTPTLT